MTRLLALADEVDEALYGPALASLGPDLVVACGDLPFDYLEYVVTITNVPLLFVPGNHDPDLNRRAGDPFSALTPLVPRLVEDEPRPWGCTNVDGRIVEAAGLVVAGLGGSIRYNAGPNQYTQAEMRRRALRLELRRLRRLRRQVDVVVAHAPPAGLGVGDDATHQGVEALNWLIGRWSPTVVVHGHVHPYGPKCRDHCIGGTVVVNAIAHRTLEVQR